MCSCIIADLLARRKSTMVLNTPGSERSVVGVVGVDIVARGAAAACNKLGETSGQVTRRRQTSPLPNSKRRDWFDRVRSTILTIYHSRRLREWRLSTAVLLCCCVPGRALPTHWTIDTTCMRRSLCASLRRASTARLLGGV